MRIFYRTTQTIQDLPKCFARFFWCLSSFQAWLSHFSDRPFSQKFLYKHSFYVWVVGKALVQQEAHICPICKHNVCFLSLKVHDIFSVYFFSVHCHIRIVCHLTSGSHCCCSFRGISLVFAMDVVFVFIENQTKIHYFRLCPSLSTRGVR